MSLKPIEFRINNDTVFGPQSKKLGSITGKTFKLTPQKRSVDTFYLNGKRAYGINEDLYKFLFIYGIEVIKLPLLGRTGTTLECPMWKLQSNGMIFGHSRVLLERDFNMDNPAQMTIEDFIEKPTRR